MKRSSLLFRSLGCGVSDAKIETPKTQNVLAK
jgi:hypothetical protein